MDDLYERCAEVLEWKRTGLLPLDAKLRELAKAMPCTEVHQNLRLAEDRTATEAMKFVIKALG